MLAKLIGTPLVFRHADDGELAREQPGAQQVVDRRQQLALSEIAGRAENHHYARTGGLCMRNVCLHRSGSRHMSSFLLLVTLVDCHPEARYWPKDLLQCIGLVSF